MNDQMIREWAERHDLPGTLTDLRAAFDDAQSLLAGHKGHKPRESVITGISENEMRTGYRRPLTERDGVFDGYGECDDTPTPRGARG